YNVAPTQLVPIVRMDKEGRRQVALFAWNFQPGWAQRSWINARAESAWRNRAFAAAAAGRRCLVPAVGWYEWQGTRTPKQPHVLHLGDFRPFSFAGIWTARELPEGWQHTFAILTRPAEGSIAAIHERMPAVVHPCHYEAWLSTETSAEEARGIALEPFGHIEHYAVSNFVNKPEQNDERCIERLRDDAGGR
ncbi:MAG TPA: SOS response-associated peptidase, partial [Gammaproteobacteria bacterium]|nr:SOS response-associated peptidase [Gammaproteobacteria bacterium]